MFGVGLGQGTSKYGWVPNANSDYVFAIIGEELGLLGCLAVLAAVRRCSPTPACGSRAAAPTRSSRLAAGAATIWLCGQAVINIGYVTGLLPVTGIPLPFISAGGTSLLATVLRARHAGVLRPARAAGGRGGAQGRAARARGPRLERWARIPVPAGLHAAEAPRRTALSTAARRRRRAHARPAPARRRAGPRGARGAAPRRRPRAAARPGASSRPAAALAIRPAPTERDRDEAP